MKEQANRFLEDQDDIDSLEQLIKIAKTDIKTSKKKDLLYQAALKSVSVVA